MKKMLTFLTILVVLLFTTNFEILASISKAYVDHGAISISSNNDFVSYGFPGSGTANDPYVIEGYRIITTNEYGIMITGSITAHFVIKDCYIADSSYGIYISNINDGLGELINNTIVSTSTAAIYLYNANELNITKNVLSSNGYGVWFKSATRVNIDNNVIANNSNDGVFIDVQSEFFSIRENNITNNKKGVSVNAPNGLIESNVIAHNDEDGIAFLYGRDTTINNNTFELNGGYAVLLTRYNSHNIVITNNNATSDGFFVITSFDELPTFIVSDNIVNNLPLGYFVNEKDLSITQDYGQLILINCTNVTISGNSFENVETAIYLVSCENLLISSSNFTDNFINGIRCDSCYNVTFNKLIFDKVLTGIALKDTTALNIKNTDFLYGEKGFLLNYDIDPNITVNLSNNYFYNLTTAIEVNKLHRSANVCDVVKIHNNTFFKVGGDTIKLTRIGNISLVSNSATTVGIFFVLNNYLYGAETEASFKAVHNTIVSTAKEGFLVVNAVFRDDMTIANNSFSGVTTALRTFSCSRLSFEDNNGAGNVIVTFSNNIAIVNNNIEGSISIERSNNFTIFGNNIHDGGDTGINLETVRNITISKNTIENFSSRAIYASDVGDFTLILNNLINSNTGIKFNPDNPQYQNNINILNNTFTGMIYGILCERGKAFENLTVKNNSFIMNHYNSSVGIKLGNGAKNVLILSNTITAGYSGIYLYYNFYSTLNNITIKGNLIRVSSEQHSTIALFVQEANDVLVTNNTIISTKRENCSVALRYLILLDDTSNALIYNNIFLAWDLYFFDNLRLAGDNDGNNNSWYEPTLKIGNYWMDYNGSGAYAIDGSTNAEDLYPIRLNDIDKDSLDDIVEQLLLGTNPNNSDTDGDDMPDGWEVINKLNPFVNDATADPDNDSLSNLLEYQYNTDPHNADTDGDNMPDGWEIENSLNATFNDAQEDPDNDGLSNYQEYGMGTDPHNADTDGDGFTDSEEMNAGTDPNDPNSYPKTETKEGSYFYVIGLVSLIAIQIFLKKRKRN